MFRGVADDVGSECQKRYPTLDVGERVKKRRNQVAN